MFLRVSGRKFKGVFAEAASQCSRAKCPQHQLSPSGGRCRIFRGPTTALKIHNPVRSFRHASEKYVFWQVFLRRILAYRFAEFDGFFTNAVSRRLNANSIITVVYPPTLNDVSSNELRTYIINAVQFFITYIRVYIARIMQHKLCFQMIVLVLKLAFLFRKLIRENNIPFRLLIKKTHTTI